MKTFDKLLFITITAFAISSLAMASQKSTDPEDYRLVVMKNCEVISDSALTQNQLDAYLALHDEEGLMGDLEGPIKDMEDDLKELTDMIEEVTELAVQETEGSIYIDKHYLKEQEELAEKIDELIDAHEGDFKALEKQGQLLEKKARVFEEAIEEGLEDLDYNQIRIITPDSDSDDYNCRGSFVVHRS